MKKTILILLMLSLFCLPLVTVKAGYWGTNVESLDVWDVSHSWGTIDYSVTHNGSPSIKCTTNEQNYIAEVDGAYRSIEAGDHIYLATWAKTDTWETPVGDASGSWFGWDFHGNGHITVGGVGYNVGGILVNDDGDFQAGHPTDEELNNPVTNSYGYSINGSNDMTQVEGLLIHTPFNTDWMYLQWDFIVPSRTYTHIWTDANGQVPGQVYHLDTPIQINGIIPWMGVRDYPSRGHSVWYSQPIMYINPEGTPNTPTATPSPYPSVSPTATQSSYPTSHPETPRETAINPVYMLIGVGGMLLVAYAAIKGKK